MGFINTDSILYLKRNPPSTIRYTEFTLRVALIASDLTTFGPFSDRSQTLDVRNRPLSSEQVYTIIVTISVLVALFVILAFTALIVIVVLVKKYHRRQKDLDRATRLAKNHTVLEEHSDPKVAAAILSETILIIYRALQDSDSDKDSLSEATFTEEEIEKAVCEMEDIVNAGLKHSQMRSLVLKKLTALVENVLQNYDEKFLVINKLFKTCQGYNTLYKENLGEVEVLVDENMLVTVAEFIEETLVCLLKKKPDLQERLKNIVHS